MTPKTKEETMDQLGSNNRWLLSVIAVVSLLGAFTIGAGISGATGSG